MASVFQREIERLLPELLHALELRQGQNLVSFVVFGSVARGEAGPGSDVDLLLVFHHLPRRRFERFLIFRQALEDLRGRYGPITADGHALGWGPVILSVEEARSRSPLYLDMVEDARILLDRDGFFAAVLEGLPARMRELSSRRVFVPDGSWYWDLKPDYRPGEVFEL